MICLNGFLHLVYDPSLQHVTNLNDDTNASYAQALKVQEVS